MRTGIHFARKRFGAALWFRLPVEAMQRRTKIVEHGREVAGQRGPATDQHIIMVGSHGYDVQPLHEFAKPAPDAIALGGSTERNRIRRRLRLRLRSVLPPSAIASGAGCD